MSIRKVSDLETVSLTDGTHDLSDVNDSLLELSFPYHSDGGHSFKSMKARYGDVRTSLLSSVFSSDTSVVFTTDATFTGGVNMLCGLNVSGDLCVNINNPDWQDAHVYVRAGDITFYGYNDIDIRSNQQIKLSAKNIYTYADTTYINGFSLPSQQIVEFSKSGTRLYTPLTSNSVIRLPTTVSSEIYSAVNVDYLNNEISSIKQWISDRDNDDNDDQLQLIGTKLYNNDDIVNVEYMLEKKYKLTEYIEDIDTGQVTGMKNSYFVEYDIKSRPTGSPGGDPSNKAIYLPSILDLSSLEVLASETTNMLKPRASNVQQTKVCLIPMSEKATGEDLSSYIVAISSSTVASTESLNVHIFAKQADFTERESGRMLLPFGQTGYYTFPTDGPLSRARYAFSTPAFTTKVTQTDGTVHYSKFMLVVQGRLGLSGVSSSTKISLYAAFSPKIVPESDFGDDTVLYSGLSRAETEYPQHERMYPQWKAGYGEPLCPAIISVDGIDVVVSGKTVRKYISDANNGYYVKSGSSYKARNETTYSYPERYAYMYTCGTSSEKQSDDYSFNPTLASESNGILTTGLNARGEFMANKSISRNTAFFKSLGTESIKADSSTFQFVKFFSITKKNSEKVNSMRIVFSVQNSKSDQFMIVNDELKVQVLQVD